MHNTKREPGCKLWSCGDNVPTPVQDISSVEAVQADIYGKSLQFSLSFAVNLKLLLGFLDSSVGKESACSAGDPGLIAELGRSPGEGNGNSLHYSCLGNPKARVYWWATLHGFTKSRTQLSP